MSFGAQGQLGLHKQVVRLIRQQEMLWKALLVDVGVFCVISDYRCFCARPACNSKKESLNLADIENFIPDLVLGEFLEGHVHSTQGPHRMQPSCTLQLINELHLLNTIPVPSLLKARSYGL